MFPLLFLLDMEIWLTEANLEETNVVQFIVIRDCNQRKDNLRLYCWYMLLLPLARSITEQVSMMTQRYDNMSH
jgi:hypothetical protein